MNIFAVITFLALAWADNHTTLGNMYISDIEGTGPRQYLSVINNKIIVGDKISTFDFSASGSLELFYTSKYICINDVGTLVISYMPHLGFSLTPANGSDYKKQLSYKGEKAFQLCSDGSIRHNSECEGAHEIHITYEEIFH